MKSFKKIIFTFILVIVILISLASAAENNKIESNKNFLKNNNDKTLKTEVKATVLTQLEAKTEATTGMTTGTNTESTVTLEEEDRYELERANAMAEIIF